MDRIATIAAGQRVYADPADREAVAFAKAFAGMKRGGWRGPHGPSTTDEKKREAFEARYKTVLLRSGFAGSGRWMYADRQTPAEWQVEAAPNGYDFWGTDFWVRRWER